MILENASKYLSYRVTSRGELRHVESGEGSRDLCDAEG
jgi:hypothetical protein